MILSLLAALKVARIIRTLKKRNALPFNIQLSQLGNIHIATLFDKSEEIMSSASVTGMSFRADIALLKALSEFAERRAFWNSTSDSLFKILPSTDGMGAYPRSFVLDAWARRRARHAALAEAIERYCWDKWWHDSSVYFENQSYDEIKSFDANLFFKIIREVLSLKEIRIIRIPAQFESNKYETWIALAVIDGGGYITGGAADLQRNTVHCQYRALSELLRHCIAISRLKKGVEASTHYENRLRYFGLGEGDLQVEARMRKQGSINILLPPLRDDVAIRHSLDDLFCVHACRFIDQPDFMGGPVDKLCI